MIYRTYGKTGKKLSLVGFGGMRFTNIDDTDACVEMMLEAARGGINYFDTAPGYFDGRSETVFGEAFAEFKRHGIPYYCATKTFKSGEKAIRDEIDGQLRRLAIETIDFYHVWCVNSLENWHKRKKKGVLATLRKLKEEGLIRHICVSSHLMGHQIRELLSEDVFEGVLFGYSAYNFNIRKAAFHEVAEQNIGCVVMNPLGGGIIPENPGLFDFIRTKSHETVVEAALHFLFSHDRITTALVGFSRKTEIKEALKAVENYHKISTFEIERISTRLSASFGALCTGCQYCDNCPEGIPIPKLMDAYNHRDLYGKDEAMLRRLKMHWEVAPLEGDKCVECGLCETACTQHLPIVARLKEIAAAGRKSKNTQK